MGNYRICLSEAQNLDDFPLLYLVHPNLAHTILHVLHVDQMLPIKVKGHTVLRESHIVRSVLHEHVFFEVTDADRVKIRQWLGLLSGIARYRDRKHAIVLLVKQSDRTFAVALVLSLIDIFDDEHVVFDLERVSVELLAADVADADVDVVAAL